MYLLIYDLLHLITWWRFSSTFQRVSKPFFWLLDCMHMNDKNIYSLSFGHQNHKKGITVAQSYAPVPKVECALSIFRACPLQNVNQAIEVHVTSIKVSSVLPWMFWKDCALCRKPISGDRTLIHYLPCKVPSSHSISLHFMDGGAGTMRLKEG